MIDSIGVVAIVAIVGLVIVVALVFNRRLYAEDTRRGWILEVGREDDRIAEAPRPRAGDRQGVSRK